VEFCLFRFFNLPRANPGFSAHTDGKGISVFG